MKALSSPRKISQLLRAISQPSRLEILMAIGTGEACVCHLEAYLGQRQAYISQHLMALRDVGIVTSRREGRNIFYRLKSPRTIELIQVAGEIAGLKRTEISFTAQFSAVQNCPCPHCSSEDGFQANLQAENLSDGFK